MRATTLPVSLAGLAALLGATPASALVNGTVEISINGAAPVLFGTAATAAADDAGGDTMMHFVGNATDPDGLWSIRWDYAADLDPTANAKVTGTATLTNHGGVPVSVDVRVRLPLCPAISGGSVLGGTCTVKLIADADGGAVTVPSGSNLWSGLTDGNDSAKLFYGPFHMGTTGSGTAQTQQLFGAPFPGMNAPAIADDVGMRHRLTVTAGDAVEVRTVLFVGGNATNFVACDPEEDTPAGPPVTGGPIADPPAGPDAGVNAPAGSTASGGPVADPAPTGGNKKSTVTPAGPSVGSGPIVDPTSTGGNGSGNGAGKKPGGTSVGSGPVADPAPTGGNAGGKPSGGTGVGAGQAADPAPTGGNGSGKQPSVTPSSGGTAADPAPPASGDAPAPAKPEGEADAGVPASGGPVADTPKRTPVRIVIPRKDEQPQRRRPTSASRQTPANPKGSGSPTSAW